MKPLKDNTLVKFVYAYLDLVYKFIPIVIGLLLLVLIPGILISGKVGVFFGDIFSVSGNGGVDGAKILYNILGVINKVGLLAAIFLGIKKLRAFIKNVFENNPFCEENGRHLKFIGFLLVAGVIVFHLSVSLAAVIIGSILPLSVELQSAALILLSVVFNPVLIIGLFIVILGEIIMHAAQIKQENDLTV